MISYHFLCDDLDFDCKSHYERFCPSLQTTNIKLAKNVSIQQTVLSMLQHETVTQQWKKHTTEILQHISIQPISTQVISTAVIIAQQRTCLKPFAGRYGAPDLLTKPICHPRLTFLA